MNKVYDSFLENLTSIECFFNKLVPLAISEDKTIINEFGESLKIGMIEEFGISPETFNTGDFKEEIKNSATKEKLERFARRVLKTPKIPPRNHEILTRSSFITLNNYFESLFSDLLTYYFKNYPGLLTEKKISISLSDLTKYSSIEEANDDLIIREIENLLLELNFEELKRYFRDTLKIPLEEKTIDWERINEIRERRHIIVHNNSIVNKKYINRSNNLDNFKEGDNVYIDEEYFNKSLEEIKLAGTILIFNCWGTWDKKEATAAIREIMMLTFDMLKSSHFDFVIKICEYVKNNIKPQNDDEEDYLLRIHYNYCIALKRLGLKDKLSQSLKKVKVGTLSPIFKIAQSVLNDDFETYFENLEKAQMVDELNFDNIIEWPLFEDIRKNPELLDRSKEILSKHLPQQQTTRQVGQPASLTEN